MSVGLVVIVENGQVILLKSDYYKLILDKW